MNMIATIEWDTTLASALLSVGASFVTAYMVARYMNRLDFEKDQKNRRTDLSIAFQAAAYRKIAQSLNPTVERASDMVGEAFEDFQIYGTAEQIALAKKFADAVHNKQKVSVNELLKELRKSIRAQLELDHIDEEPWHFRTSNDVYLK